MSQGVCEPDQVECGMQGVCIVGAAAANKGQIKGSQRKVADCCACI